MDFNNIDALLKQIEKELQKVVVSDIADEIIKIAQDKVQTEVYDKYTPKMYERTFMLKHSFVKNNIGDGVEIDNIYRDDGRSVGDIVETGKGYMYHFPFDEVPRPFMEETNNELLNKNIISERLKEGMRKRGYDID